MRIITFGTFDLFHIGHLNILRRCKEIGDYLVVGVSSDELNQKKNKKSSIPLKDRMEIIKSIKYVDEVFVENSLELKDEYIKRYNADILIMGDDWKGKFDWVSCKTIYLERTQDISTTEIKQEIISYNNNSSRIKILLEKLFWDYDNKYYLASIGIVGSKCSMYNEFVHVISIVLFKILDSLNLDYYVFAGSAIGLCRDGKNIPWVDDYDIMIFDDQIEYFENNIIPLLIFNNYTVKQYLQYGIHAGYQIFYKNFQCDVFYSKIENGIVKGCGNWGRYNWCNIPIDLVKPKQYQLFHGINLPFFNDYKKDIEMEYGDIISKCSIQINHGVHNISIPYNFNEVYKEFDNIKYESIKNMKNLLNNCDLKNKFYIDSLNNINSNIDIYSNFLNINFNLSEYYIYFINIVKILKYIKEKNFVEIELPIHLLEYTCDIKFYLPELIIIVKIDSEYENIFKYLNWVDKIIFTTDNLDSYYFNKDIFWSKKPNYTYFDINLLSIL